MHFDATARLVLEFLGAPDPEAALRAVGSGVRSESVGKYRQQSARKQRQALAITKPLLLSLGYLDADIEPPRPSLWHSRSMDDLIDRYKKRFSRRGP
ncbi:hypothetical protein D3C83_89620 [compost metagenome]